MEYSILNCWTDDNRGDLGIMISTINEIRRQDSKAEIIGISCFSKLDNYYSNAHNELKTYVDELYPAIFGVIVFRFGKFTSKSKIAKYLVSLFEAFRMALAIVLPKKISLKLLYSFERKTLNRIKKSDISISKGGSIFTDYKTYRGTYALFRTCMFYFLLHKFNCPYFILGQSFGPIGSKFGSWLVNKVIKNSEGVYLREMICKRKYTNIKYPNDKLSFSNDTAFLLDEEKIDINNIKKINLNIGLTVRPTNKNFKEYKKSIIKTIIYFIDKYDAHFHIFPQVIDPNEPDIKMGKTIYKDLPKQYRDNLVIHETNYNPEQLKYLYGLMNFFIGTRLHSNIFALGAGTPSISLVYHGTKAQGIYENLELNNLVVKPINAEEIINKGEYILENHNEIQNKIISSVEEAKITIINSIKEIISQTKTK
ncbi:polysaccharide pyruvyl transferase family protein [Halanaerobium congolense]|uniref:Polysaccharide pyruvyl transferase family protein WcaK n=1 Tax=Halanaerobium congolense TaxID=54121 RepID=A0A1G6MSK7_9FIRM|nr:polysaccharide pyruvyl transferase family protein [Halanaerobium congolense]SDC57955.1 Polysaccharide pyruvyl transferase family protein WcaK [Halanaerobium congolense]